MQYEDMVFKIPMESDTYKEGSDFVFRQRRGAGLATAQVKNIVFLRLRCRQAKLIAALHAELPLVPQ